MLKIPYAFREDSKIDFATGNTFLHVKIDNQFNSNLYGVF